MPHGRAPLIERGDRLWDSSAVAHMPRAGISTCPTAPALSAIMADVLAQQEDQLGRGTR